MGSRRAGLGTIERREELASKETQHCPTQSQRYTQSCRQVKNELVYDRVEGQPPLLTQRTGRRAVSARRGGGPSQPCNGPAESSHRAGWGTRLPGGAYAALHQHKLHEPALHVSWPGALACQGCRRQRCISPCKGLPPRQGHVTNHTCGPATAFVTASAGRALG